MTGIRLYVLVWVPLLLSADAVKGPHHRRSAQGNLPSKGGWRPVVGSGGIYYGPLGTAPLHSSYKVPLLDVYQSSMRPIATRDVTKLTSIAQSYRPTTLRTVPAQTAHPGHQPINSYLNPFALPSNGVTHYKFVQNYQPAESVLIRNQQNPYAARPMQKHPSKQKPQYHNNILQQLTNVQQIQFGQYSTGKPLDLFAAPIDYKREKRPNSAETEIYKPEVYKISESESSPQFVKTAQQQGGQKIAQNPYAQYSFHDLANFHQFPPSILGTFGSFGVQSVKGRDPLHQVTKNSFLQAQPTKHTIFNSFGYTPTFKTTPAIFSSTTPKLQTVPNHLLFGSGFGNFATQQTKLDVPLKIDPNAGIKNSFKPSPYDAFTIKNAYNFDINKVTTYNPPLIQSTTPLYFNDYGAQVNGLLQNYNNQKNTNYNNINNKKQQSDSVGLTQQLSQQYVDAPDALNLQNNQFNQMYHPYEVVENEPEELKTQSPWTVTPEQNQDSDTKQDEADNNIDEKLTTPGVDQKEEFAIITGNEKDFNNGFNYNQAESQSRRPLGDDFEPIGKQKLKDYYYRVSTPAYNSNNKPVRRTKKPNESVKPVQEITTEVTTYADNTDASSAPLPTLPPNLHFKRPNSNDTTIDKDKIRKRNKIRRRRPQLANINRNKTENATQNETSTEPPTTVADEIHTIRPRPRTTKTSVTTQTITTDLTTSALPTTAPTRPTVIKKKLVGHRRPFTTTTTEKYEATTTTTTSTAKEHDYSRESPIMKISTRPHHQKTTASYDFKINETPDYSHKQDEKDTPTSDVSVSLTDTLKTSSDIKEFSFHRDARPVEMKETTESLKDTNDAETSQNEDTSPRSKLRPRLKNKFDRPKFSMKDYRSRLNSTTTTEKSTENTPKPRVSIRKPPSVENYFTEVETTTERKKFTPKEPRHKLNRTDNNEPEIHSRQVNRQNKPNAEEQDTTPPQKISARIRSGQRRPRPTEETTESTSPNTLLLSKRPLRKKVYDSDVGESVNDIVTENTHDHKDYTSERTRSESAIMKIADKKHHDHAERVFEQSKRVSDLTLAASKDYNTPGMFKTVASNSRRIPSYFTIATDDPILPIEAFFPQLNQKKEA